MTVKVGGWPAVPLLGLVFLLLMTGCGGSSSTANNVTATPSFSPGGGTYNSSQTVTISDATQGAVLYCTTDGTTPTSSSPQCSQPTTVFKSEFLQAIAVAPGKTPSAAASAGYTIDLKAADTPVFNPSGGSYSSAQSVTISDATSGANIYYTTDGSTPTASSALYTGPISVSTSETLNAIAVASGYNNSGVASAAYAISQAIAAPIFSVASGTYTSPQTVTITDANKNATIYYAINSTSVSVSSTPYTGPITVSQTEIISAIAIVSGSSSPVAIAAYTIQLVPAPTFTPASGAAVNAGQAIALADGDPNASIYYTTNGSVPTSSSTPYNAATGIPLTGTGTVTIQAIAIDSGTSSSVASATYTVIAAVVPAPTFNPASGTSITVNGTVTLSDTDTNATIYYTTDGTPPSSSSSKYSAPIALTTVGSVTINAIAIDSGNSSAVATATYTVAAAVTPINGTVMSGTHAVNGATVQLYAAGILQNPTTAQPGYGTNATALGSPAVSDSNGKFSITSYTCPASPGDLVYVVASSGDSGNGTNSGLQLMTALGPCGNLSNNPFVVNEVTTVTSAYSLAQFMTTAPNVGAPASNYRGLSSAFATVGNLVDITTGSALSITPAYANNTVPFLNTSTAPQMRVNTLANILNGCANTNGSGTGCSNLWGAATPPSGTAPTNTLQAMADIAQNPGVNVTTLFGLASSSGPFQPVLPSGSAPNDWTLALTFTGGGFGISPSTLGTDSAGDAGVGPTISTSLAIDVNGNVWVAGFGLYGYPSFSLSNLDIPILAEFNNLGAPQTQATTQTSDATPVITFGGYNLGQTPNSGLGLGSIAIDTKGNIWAGDLSSGGSLYVVSPSLSPLASVGVGKAVHALAIDNNNNAWVGGTSHLAEFTYVTGNTTLQTGVVSTANIKNISDLAFDSAFNLWAYDDASARSVYQLSITDGSIVYNAFPARGSRQAISLAADGAGNVDGCGDPAGNILDVFTASPSPTIANTLTLGSRGCGEQLLLDGQGRLFAISNGFGPAGLTGATIDEYTTAGTVISPPNGYTGTSSAEPVTIAVDSNLSLGYRPRTGGIDGSGNLWLVNADTSNSGGASGGTTGNVLVEFVGIAAPVVTPTSVALTNGQLGLRP